MHNINILYNLFGVFFNIFKLVDLLLFYKRSVNSIISRGYKLKDK